MFALCFLLVCGKFFHVFFFSVCSRLLSFLSMFFQSFLVCCKFLNLVCSRITKSHFHVFLKFLNLAEKFSLAFLNLVITVYSTITKFLFHVYIQFLNLMENISVSFLNLSLVIILCFVITLFLNTQPYVRKWDKDSLEKFVDPYIVNQHDIFRFKLFPLLPNRAGFGGKHWTLGQYDTETSEWRFYNSLRTRTTVTKDKHILNLQDIISLQYCLSII